MKLRLPPLIKRAGGVNFFLGGGGGGGGGGLTKTKGL